MKNETQCEASELLPCFFCGAVPTIVYKNAPSNIVRCENGGCPTRPSTKNHQTWEDCVGAWNTRAWQEIVKFIQPTAQDKGQNDAINAISFALTIDDYFEMKEFLRQWEYGDTSEWPEFNYGRLR